MSACSASFRAAQAHCLPPRPATLPAETDLVREYDPELHAPYLTLPDQRWVHGRTHNGSRRRVTVEQKGLLRRCRRAEQRHGTIAEQAYEVPATSGCNATQTRRFLVAIGVLSSPADAARRVLLRSYYSRYRHLGAALFCFAVAGSRHSHSLVSSP